jgi:hypothetical protein
MNRKVKILIIVVALVALSALSAIWAMMNLSTPPPGVSRFPIFPGDIEAFYVAGTVISTINVTLLIVLLIMYVQIYERTHSEFTVGLIIFSAVLLLYALSSDPIVRWVFGFRAVGLGPFAMLPDLFTCIALVTLLYLTVKY